MERRRNLLPWAGVIVTLAGFLSYFFFFARFPATRDVPWANWLILAAGTMLAGAGARRAFTRAEKYRGKASGSILVALSILISGLFGYYTLRLSKQLPQSNHAPHVGDYAPDFTLPDKDGKPVKLSEVLYPASRAGGSGEKAPNSVVLIFYRGYW